MALLFPCKKAGGIGLASLVITTPPTTTTFAQYDTLDLTGLKVTATFKDGLVADVTDLCQISPADGSELSDYGNIDITIKYANKTVTQSITVNQMTAIAVTTQPTKTRYLVGENLNLSGIVVTGTAGALSRNVTSLAEYDPADGTQLNTQGTQRIDVEYRDVNTFFDIDVTIRQLLKNIPYSGSISNSNFLSVVFNGELHVFYGYSHFKWNGNGWDTLEQNISYFTNESCCAVVYKGKICILRGVIQTGTSGGSSEDKTICYAWDGTSWSTLFESIGRYHAFEEFSATVWNNEIHFMGNPSYYDGYSIKKYNHGYHYSWNGTSITTISTNDNVALKVQHCVVNFQNNMYLLGGYDGATGFYKWNGTGWTSMGTLPYSFRRGGAIVFNNKLHILGGSSSPDNKNHYAWNGTSWESVSTPPWNVERTCVVVWNSGANDEIVLIGTSASSASNYRKSVAQWDGSSWTVATE